MILFSEKYIFFNKNQLFYFNHIVLDFIKIILFNLKIKVDPNSFFEIYHG